MSAVIDIEGTRATFNGKAWSCPDQGLEDRLNAIERLRIMSSPLYQPHRIKAAAEHAVSVLGGTVVEVDPFNPGEDDDPDEGDLAGIRIY